MKPLLPLLPLIALTGCVQTQFHKSVTVQKDANGKVTSSSETESVTQPGSAWPVHFEYLKLPFGGADNKGPAKSPADSK